MNYGLKTADTNNLQALANRAGAKITGAIQQASAKTGVGFSYLLQQANVESSFKTDAKAKSSSATGLYQFIDKTWLSMVKEHGAEYGLGSYAKQISDNGTVANKSVRNKILSLRKDPAIASAMAAEYASDNKDYLENNTEARVGSTELYMAHFMGPGGAAKFLNKLQNNPNASGVAAFPKEACSNSAVFYNEDGSARTLSQIYAFFDNKFQGGTDTGATSYAANSTDNAMVSYASATTPTNASGRANIFDEATGTWFSTSNPKDVKWASMAPRQNGTIAGLQSAMANPVDVMQIMQISSFDDERSNYNS